MGVGKGNGAESGKRKEEETCKGKGCGKGEEHGKKEEEVTGKRGK